MIRTAIWGAGQHCKRMLQENPVRTEEIVAFIDKDPDKQSREYFGKPVVAPEKLKELEIDRVVVAVLGIAAWKEVTAYVEENLSGGIPVISADSFAEEQWKHTTMNPGGILGESEAERERVLKAAREWGSIPASSLLHTRVLADREQVLDYIPKGGIVAEVGVAYGDFSKKILERVKPERFIAVDFFAAATAGFWGRTDFFDADMTHQQWYEHRFQKQIEDGSMEVCQGMSWEVLDTFPDDYFDFVYLDADHSLDSVCRDVDVLRRKVKNGGIIAFNDYTLCDICVSPKLISAYYGVVPAANRFIQSTNSEVLFLALDSMMFNDIVVRFRKA